MKKAESAETNELQTFNSLQDCDLAFLPELTRALRAKTLRPRSAEDVPMLLQEVERIREFLVLSVLPETSIEALACALSSMQGLLCDLADEESVAGDDAGAFVTAADRLALFRRHALSSYETGRKGVAALGRLKRD